MGRRVALAVFGCLLVAAVFVAPATAQQPRGPVVTPNVQVTTDVTPGRTHTEPQMLVHPDDPNILVIPEVEFNTSTCQVYVSLDRGRTWAKSAANAMPPGYRACVRPNFGSFFAAKFGVDGTLYLAGTAAGHASSSGPNDPFVARTRDLGRTWEYSIVKKSEERDFPKPDGTTARDFERFGYVRLAVHPTDPLRVYAGFRRQGAFQGVAQVSERTMVAVSTDGGATFGPLVDVLETSFPLTDVKGSDQPGLAVDKEGTIYAFTKERPPLATTPGPTQAPVPTPPGPANACRPASASPAAQPWVPTPVPATPPGIGQPGAGSRMFMAKSTDDGRTWRAKTVETSGVVCGPCLTTPEAAVDARTGDVYVVWEQSDTGPPNPRDDRNIWFMKSEDGGETFTSRVQLNDDRDPNRRPNYDQMFPGISIAPNGRVDIAWWDFRTDALYNPAGNGNTTRRDQTCFDIFYTSSSDGGASWAPNTRISDRSMNQNEGFAMNLAYDLRGPIGVASTDEEAFVTWSDSRNGTFDLPTEDAYFAKVIHEEPETGGGDGPAIKASSVVLGLTIGLVLAGLAVATVAGNARRSSA
ncbi:MAG TPA: sialidase family protein [Acidimicrobiales bacterium]|nr:sialidase family protein [Acidimicrobiales bacterium]